jgi:hypothetical protein
MRSIQKWFVEMGLEELDWPAQSPDLNPVEYLGDELERRLRARPNCPTSLPDLTNALVAEWKQVPAAMLQYQVKSLPRIVGAVIAANAILMPMILGIGCSTSRCPQQKYHTKWMMDIHK